jgi:hypothetical protein
METLLRIVDDPAEIRTEDRLNRSLDLTAPLPSMVTNFVCNPLKHSGNYMNHLI